MADELQGSVDSSTAYPGPTNTTWFPNTPADSWFYGAWVACPPVFGQRSRFGVFRRQEGGSRGSVGGCALSACGNATLKTLLALLKALSFCLKMVQLLH
jgi:hypothetical protein